KTSSESESPFFVHTGWPAPHDLLELTTLRTHPLNNAETEFLDSKVEMEQKQREFCGNFGKDNSENPKFSLGSRNLKFFKEDIFNVPFDKLADSASYKHFTHVFVDNEDYEDFKQDLINFHRMRSRWQDDRKKVSRERPSRLNSLIDDADIQRFKTERNAADNNAIDSQFEDHIYEEIDDVKEQVARLRAEERKSETVSTNTKKYSSLHVCNCGDIKTHLSCSEDCDCVDFALESLPMMEFFQNDEHFQEFDRVFETVKNKRRYASNSSLDNYRWSPHSDGRKSDDSSSEADTDTEIDTTLKVDDIFSDFFDNDADFKNFEEEFGKFQFKRHSTNLEKKWHRNSAQLDALYMAQLDALYVAQLDALYVVKLNLMLYMWLNLMLYMCGQSREIVKVTVVDENSGQSREIVKVTVVDENSGQSREIVKVTVVDE
ncbi:hypothetical protein DPMN_113250, partial [Dreissena polymorpha]